MKKTLICILTIVSISIIVSIVLICDGSKYSNTSNNESEIPVADIERKVNIWNTVPGNTSKSKLDDMNIDYNSNLSEANSNALASITNLEYQDIEKQLDTYTYLAEIQSGYEKETYEDEPYIIPYLVEGSDSAVIVIPGGGFYFKSMDGSTHESKTIAETLNTNGINAFVLHYRSNPYEYPIPFLDLQRSIRYLRYHAEEYGIDKNKISVIGFSAGGNLIAHYINNIQGNNHFPDDYVLDEIDKEDDRIEIASMIYPVITFNNNVPMLFALFDDDDVRDEVKRIEMLNLMSSTKNFNSKDVNQFVAYGLSDSIVGVEETNKYIEKAKEEGTNIYVVAVENGEHGFGQKYYMEEYIKWFKENI